MSSPAQIVSLLRSRDQKGLRTLFSQYGPALNGVIVRIVKDHLVAEEVLQDTLLKIWEKIEQFDDSRSAFFTWMMGIARNAAIDRVRLKGFQRSQKSETFDPHVHEYEHSTIDASAVDVATLVGSLDEKYISVLQKVYLEGYSTSAAAEELDLPLGTVKTRVRTAMSLLREKIKSEKKLFLGSFLLSLLVLILWALR